jgi:phosphoglycolate phosphatase-like HAD superfamily hydrolase
MTSVIERRKPIAGKRIPGATYTKDSLMKRCLAAQDRYTGIGYDKKLCEQWATRRLDGEFDNIRYKSSRFKKRVNKKKKGRETMKKVNSKKFTSTSTSNTLQSETVIEEFDSVKAIFERVLKELPAYQAKLNKDDDKDKKCVAVFDLDETVLKNTDAGTRTFPNIRNFINTLRRRGVTIVFITARRESSRQETIKTLTKLKLVGQLVMRPDDAGKSSNVKAAQRKQIAEKAGCSLFLNVGDQLSDISPSTEWHLVSKTFSTLPEGSAVGRAVRSADPTHDHHHRLKHAFNILDTPFLVWGGLGGDMIKHTHMSVKMPNLGTFTK